MLSMLTAVENGDAGTVSWRSKMAAHNRAVLWARTIGASGPPTLVIPGARRLEGTFFTPQAVAGRGKAGWPDARRGGRGHPGRALRPPKASRAMDGSEPCSQCCSFL